MLLSRRWSEATFGPHFTISPVEGMIAPLVEAGMEAVFSPEGVDDDIRQEGALCMIEVKFYPGSGESPAAESNQEKHHPHGKLTVIPDDEFLTHVMIPRTPRSKDERPTCSTLHVRDIRLCR